MIAVIEAGGTKTEIRLGNTASSIYKSGPGINPYFQTDSEIEHRLGILLAETPVFEGPLQLFYYGAGCGTEMQKNRIRNAIEKFLPGTYAEVDHDLLGTARALCGSNPGFAGILGTGSNACYYNGQKIENQIVSLGFWLGDEGSGGYIGKTLFSDWLKGNLPSPIEDSVTASFPVCKEDALQMIYADKNPNKTLAALAPVCFQNRGSEYVETLLRQAIELYFDETAHLFAGREEIELNFTGSIALLLADILQESACKRNKKIGKILAAPSEALFQYHTFSI